MKYFFLITTLVFSPLLAEEFGPQKPKVSSMVYVTSGVGPYFVTPTVGFGYRSRLDSLGVDFGINASSFTLLSVEYQCVVDIIYTPTPTWNSPLYVGAGVTGGCVIHVMDGPSAVFSPDLVVGQEYSGFLGLKRFVELRLQVPQMTHEGELSFFPSTYLKFGVGF